jgi:hypothetical protein
VWWSRGVLWLVLVLQLISQVDSLSSDPRCLAWLGADACRLRVRSQCLYGSHMAGWLADWLT